MTAEDRVLRRRVTGWLLLGAATVVIAPLLERDLWFDEALTLLHFALLPSVGAIWNAYVIPNNQLLHTVLLHFWMPVTDGWFSFNAGLRLLPLLTALITVLMLWRGGNRSCGWAALLMALAAWILSPPFALFGSALRGYMLAALAVTAAWLAAERWAGGSRMALGLFFAAAFAGVAAVPTTLAGIGAALLLAFADRDPLRNGRFWLAVGAIAAAFGLCYGPIAPSFLAVCRLREGWQNGWAAWLVTGAAAASAFAPLVLIGGFFYLIRMGKRRLRQGDLWRLGIWLMPLFPCLLLPVAPFPRVFWCFFPLWVVLTARGLRPFLAWARKKRRFRLAVAAVGIAVVAWGATMNDHAVGISDRWIGNGDDFFAPYYRRAGFQPAALMAEIARQWDDHSRQPVLYASFAADPWALCLYGRMTGVEVRFDGPRGAAAGPFDGAVFHCDESRPEAWKMTAEWFRREDWVVVK